MERRRDGWRGGGGGVLPVGVGSIACALAAEAAELPPCVCVCMCVSVCVCVCACVCNINVPSHEKDKRADEEKRRQPRPRRLLHRNSEKLKILKCPVHSVKGHYKWDLSECNACGCTIAERCCFNGCALGGAPAAAVSAAGEDIVRARAAAGRNGLVSAQTAERARRRPPKEEAGAKASAPDDSAATSTSRGLHIVAIQAAVRVGSNGIVARPILFLLHREQMRIDLG